MSISSVSGGGSGLGFHAMKPRMKPPDLTKDQFSQIKEKLTSEGKDTSNLDKIIENFDALDTDKDGKISKTEMESGAEQFGIELPKGPPDPPPGGPPPGFQMTDKTSDSDSTSDSLKTLLDELVKSFNKSDPDSSTASWLSSIDTAA
jgi:hypothetical protein